MKKYEKFRLFGMDWIFLLFCFSATPGSRRRTITRLKLKLSKLKLSVPHLCRWHPTLWNPHTSDSCWRTPCTSTDSARRYCTCSNTAARCCVWEADKTGWSSAARCRTAAWSTPWRPCVRSSSYRTPCPSCRYGGPPVYRRSGPDLHSVWWLSSLRTEHTPWGRAARANAFKHH